MSDIGFNFINYLFNFGIYSSAATNCASLLLLPTGYEMLKTDWNKKQPALLYMTYVDISKTYLWVYKIYVANFKFCNFLQVFIEKLSRMLANRPTHTHTSEHNLDKSSRVCHVRITF